MSRTRERADNRRKRPAHKKSEVTAAGVFRLVRKLKGSLKVGKKSLKYKEEGIKRPVTTKVFLGTARHS